jgi:hypothetical protein
MVTLYADREDTAGDEGPLRLRPIPPTGDDGALSDCMILIAVNANPITHGDGQFRLPLRIREDAAESLARAGRSIRRLRTCRRHRWRRLAGVDRPQAMATRRSVDCDRSAPEFRLDLAVRWTQ